MYDRYNVGAMELRSAAPADLMLNTCYSISRNYGEQISLFKHSKRSRTIHMNCTSGGRFALTGSTILFIELQGMPASDILVIPYQTCIAKELSKMLRPQPVALVVELEKV